MPPTGPGDDLPIRISIVVPAGEAERVSLPTTLPAICLAAGRLQEPAEVLVVTPAAFGPLPAVGDGRPLHVTAPDRGKFAAVRAGADHARGEVLVFVDADALPAEDAFRHVAAPLLGGDADVCAGQVAVARRARGTGVQSLLERWGSASTAAWHALRSREGSRCWALPGPLHAIRRELLPRALLAGAVDDASIGLQAREAGARFAYAPDARTLVLMPSTYVEWLGQNLRNRIAWAVLGRHRPADVRALRARFRRYLAAVAVPEPTGVLFLAHVELLTVLAWLCERLSIVPGGRWTEARSTKRWAK